MIPQITPADVSASTPMTINEVEALARQLIPVPIGALILTQSLQTCFEDRANIVRWTISHFPPNNCQLCTQAEGQTPLEALSILINKLIPCPFSTPSA
jgi:hypothetical protein